MGEAMSIFITREELKDILEKHAQYLKDYLTGERAYLKGANLKGANISGTILEGRVQT